MIFLKAEDKDNPERKFHWIMDLEKDILDLILKDNLKSTDDISMLEIK